MWKRVLLGVGIAVVVVAGFMVQRIGPRNIIGMLRYDTRREGHLQPGDAAPDVVAFGLDGASRVSVLERTGSKPLVLVFGSFT